MAILASINLGLIAVDLSYVPFRDFYLRYLPEFTLWYGENFKGIEDHRDTQAYLARVVALEEQVAQDGLRSPQAEAILTELQTISGQMIDENPFQVADKTGTLEKIKNRMRDRVEDTTEQEVDSSRDAFIEFWSADYLTDIGWSDSIGFFNEDIAPLIATNYYRGIGEDGRPLDQFWHIDRWFVIIFAIEFALRTLYLSRRYAGINWIDAIFWRWYDILLLIPFWRWLRIIPVSVRLGQSELGDSVPLINRLRRAFISNFAVELTEIVVIRVLDQTQNLIRDGELARMILQPDPARRYVDLNGVDEIAVISQRLTTLLVEHVLPKIKPDIDELLKHSVQTSIKQLPGFQNVSNLPGMEAVYQQLTNQLVADLSSGTISAVKSALQDEKGAELTQKIIQRLGDTFRDELREQNTVEEIQALMAVLLDEVKINYVQRLEEEDLEEIQEQAQREIYELTRSSRKA